MISFLKMHGLGNDFVVIDNRKAQVPLLDWSKIADRQRGIGCDQVVVLEASANADIFMRLYNADGSEAESCGNASRCIAWLIAGGKPGIARHKNITIETLAGVIEAQVTDEHSVTVDMGKPGLGWRDIPLSEKKDALHLKIGSGVLKDPVGVSMGNPHMVFFVPDAAKIPLEVLGPKLERHALFPARANIGVAQVVSKNHILLRVWERGAGLTLACGTGACAALVAAHQRGLCEREATVQLPGGDLTIAWRERDNHVLMTGPVAVSFKGTWEPEFRKA